MAEVDPDLAECVWCDSTERDCRAWAELPGKVKCCPDCDHRRRQDGVTVVLPTARQ